MLLEELYQVPVPRATDSYSPVPHKELIEHVQENLDKKGLVGTAPAINTAREGQQLIGYIDVKHPESKSMGMRIAFRNSYDKSMSVAFVAGASVWICSNGMISGEISYMRKHTGAVMSELKGTINLASEKLEDNFRLNIEAAKKMYAIDMDLTASAELVGRMFVEEEIINVTQMSIIKREMSKPSFEAFSKPNLWSLYNHVTYSFKKSHPTTYMQNHLSLHKFVNKEFSL